MKRLIAAMSFAVIASPVLATPFEQTELDRQLPNIAVPAAVSVSIDSASAPFEQAQLDRVLPSLSTGNARLAQYGGSTRSDRDIATDASAESPFANDYNFIAPAQ